MFFLVFRAGFLNGAFSQTGVLLKIVSRLSSSGQARLEKCAYVRIPELVTLQRIIAKDSDLKPLEVSVQIIHFGCVRPSFLR